MRVRLPLVAATVCVMTIAACGERAPAPTAGVTPVVLSASAPGETPTLSPTPTPTPTPEGSPASYPPSPGGGDVVADESLLAILPPDLDGLPVTAEDQAFAEAASDPAFRRNVARAVFPIVVSDENLASGVVAQLIPRRYTDEFFRDWRDSYNDGACGQAGGVARNAEIDLDGRTVYIGTCVEGMRTYHAWLADRNVIVSLFAIGEGQFGERLMSDLRP